MITKFLLKYGFGSPGSTAKTYCDRYSFYYNDGLFDVNSIFDALYEERKAVSNHLPNSHASKFKYLTKADIRVDIKGDFPLFIFIMMFLETESFRDGVSTQSKLLITSAEIIHETVSNRLPQLIRYDLYTFINLVGNYTNSMYNVVKS